MGKQERVKQIAALKAANLPPLTWRDVFTPTEGADPISAKDQAAMDAYFSVFVAWPKNDNGESVCMLPQDRARWSHGGDSWRRS